MEWRDSLRANLSLWPNLTSNLAALGSCAGKPWDEAAFLSAIKVEAAISSEGGGGVSPSDDVEQTDVEDIIAEHGSDTAARKTATTNRTVRQTIEVMILGGLAYRNESKIFFLTLLGRELLSFLRVEPNRPRVANPQNVHLAGRLVLPGLLAVPEYRAILLLVAAADGRLSTEELNRAMRTMSMWSFPDHHLINGLAEQICAARKAGDVTALGARWYREEDYATAKDGDQRKAINPWMLLAGGGGASSGACGTGGTENSSATLGRS